MLWALALCLPPALGAAAPTPGAVAFVVDSSVVVRESPRDGAAPVAEVPIWTAVHVDALGPQAPAPSTTPPPPPPSTTAPTPTKTPTVPAPEALSWARVTLGPRLLRYDTPGGEAHPVAPARFDGGTVGWVPLDSLDTSPTSRAGLVAEAKSAPEQKKRVLLLRAWALDPNDAEVAALVTSPSSRAPTARHARSPFAHADLVAGCRGDVTRAEVVVGSAAALAGRAEPADACAAHIELRVPCDDVDKGPHKAALARFTPRFGKDGPALRLVPALGAGDRPTFVVTELLEFDGCGADCTPAARPSDVKVERLRVPRVDDGRTILHVMVPRYTGALYDIVTEESAEDVDVSRESFELGESFDNDPRDDPGVGDHLFSAPQACCACDDEP